MRQAVIVAADRCEVRPADTPTVRDPGEVVLRTAACGICSGDLMPWYLAKKVGTVFGHEPVGHAVAVGEDVRHVRPGDLVFVHHHAPCGECADCRRGAVVHCATWRRTRLDPGGMAEYLRAPAEIVANDCFPVNDLQPEQALFIEPLGCCVKAFVRLGGRAAIEGRRVAVVGCGVMGLLNVMTARAFGADEVVAVEPHPARRQAALACGANAALTPEEAASLLHRAVDAVVIGPGFPPVIEAALGYVRDGGQASLFTPTAVGVRTALDLGDLYFREITLVPSYSCGPDDTRRAYDLIRTERVQPRPLITHRFPLADMQQAFDTARAGGEAIKVVIVFDEEIDG
ncbi:MAG: alcohol dehydrogenase catalytic domain-containing protein [Gemmataceae bacterium]